MGQDMAYHELIYFGGAGHAESIRLAFTLAKVPFADTQLSLKEWYFIGTILNRWINHCNIPMVNLILY